MTTLRRIRKFIWSLQDARRKRRLQAALGVEKEIAAARVRHGQVKPLIVKRQQGMTTLLRGR